MDKTIYWIQHTKKNGSRKNGDKDRKALHKLMNNAVYRKAFENSRNKIDIKLVNKQKKRLFTMYIKTKLYAAQSIWHWFSCDTKKQSCIRA